MKKLMIALGAIAFCGAVSADIASANCVGYVTSTVPKDGSKTFALTLTDCVNPGAPVRIDNLLASADFFGSGNFDAADQIWRWDTTVQKWAKYFYEKTGRGTSVSYAWKKWNYADSKVEALTDADVVNPGETFIFTRAGEEITLTLAGQVKEFSATPSYSIPSGGSVYMAYPWPIEIKVADINSLVDEDTAAAFFGNSNFGAADQIWCWDTKVQKWAKYFYEKTGRGTSVSYAWKKWNYAEGKVEAITDADKLAPGEGFIFTRAGETLTFTWKALESEAK